MSIEYCLSESQIIITDRVSNCDWYHGQTIELYCTIDNYGVKLSHYKIYDTNNCNELCLVFKSYYFIYNTPKPLGIKNAYIIFAIQMRPIIIAQNPELKNSAKKGTPSITSIIGEMWQNLQDRSPYVELAEVDHKRYNKEITFWKSIYESGENMSETEFLYGDNDEQDEDQLMLNTEIVTIIKENKDKINKYISIETVICKKLIKIIIN